MVSENFYRTQCDSPEEIEVSKHGWDEAIMHHEGGTRTKRQLDIWIVGVISFNTEGPTIAKTRCKSRQFLPRELGDQDNPQTGDGGKINPQTREGGKTADRGFHIRSQK